MKTLTRDEFESLVTTKTPVAELPDGSSIELTVEQAMQWYDQFAYCAQPSLALEVHRWIFLGEKLDDFHRRDGLHQIGGTQ